MSESVSETSQPVAEQLYHVKLLSALRSGEPAAIHSLLTEIGKDRRKSVDGDIDTGAAALHLAVRCASKETIALLLAHRAISPNGVHPPGSGTTPLHLAASLGRLDAVNLLLEQENIDDSLRDSNGKTCRDVARNKEIVRAIDDSRSFLNASYRSLLHSYILSPPNDPPSQALIDLLESPRVKFVDLSYLDNDSGFSLLHEAAKRKDLRLIELAVRAGADVFLRDRRGKMAHEAAGKDDRVKVFLRQFANHDKTLIQSKAPPTEAPSLRGYLNKYANVAKGYNTRWFVLKNGVLSYYRHQEDETVASRGSISMRNAVLKVSEKTRFEISTVGYYGGTAQKWYLKANHPVEAHRWTQAINQSIEWVRQEAASSIDERRRPSGESDSSGVRSTPSVHSHNPVPPTMKKSLRSRLKDSISLTGSSSNVDLNDHNGPNLAQNEESAVKDDEDEDEGSSSSQSERSGSPPHENFELHGNATVAQLEITSQLLAKHLDAITPHDEAHLALKQSLSSVHDMLNEYIQMARERDEYWRKQLKKEKKRQSFWEESLATVVREGENLERELRARSKRRGSRTFGPLDTVKSPTRPAALSLAKQPSPVNEQTPPATPAKETSTTSPTTAVPPAIPPTAATPSFPGDIKTPSRRDTIVPNVPPPTSITSAPSDSSATEPASEPPIDIDTDEEDEFFDAIESNNLPNLVVPEGLTSPTVSQVNLPIPSIEPYAGYTRFRERLRLNADERPSISLWAVLKGSIGKDLTKISLPVFFNEPTSMLQRMAEDMEFSECLDIAATEKDPLRRIAYVAAFAMSNYSSTLGRIAKPFNPMLSETFEYVRLDRKYRYVSEQVSHHPPISACWAESPLWHYYGEVDAQNKFLGKSFEVRPTGIAHADLLLPEEQYPHYPKATGPGEKGKVVEHYSWKKVTTSISGFILGSPTIDHYGDLVVTNHRTGDQCILTFKPRGWRAKDSYEISGQVISSKGRVAYEIAGRWTSQLIMKQVGVGGATLHPDLTVAGPNSPSASPEYILLWRNSEKPTGSPFNLTPFAITLNHCPLDTLKPFLCPTDCRLRVDQRAFELGLYELANKLKHEQEEKQRAIRRAREAGQMEPHKPRWFIAETEPDTGERVWNPYRAEDNTVEYWKEREKVWAQGGNAPWKDVDDIFIEEPSEITRLMEQEQETS
ncbi:oxysterol-binding protein [Coprinopsis cinerea okayama7|uniref:Oxysterol-binding protein n=1 Tax=Coprinopsis cinerea (strain Okayama-7 / 130 / ATCC MYA-4618 / FGSC 9003) TaxID=240176 RepID=A8NLF9_COPC7|nr:oxysterol-binding protein [Coprinopsis cinerea okayama7\|eukprot:XP_001834676.1 oxysterol-binding protein [Coprinopsis cinerea okayama7\